MRRPLGLAALGALLLASCADIIGATFGDYQGPTGAGGAGGSTTATGTTASTGGGGSAVSAGGGAAGTGGTGGSTGTGGSPPDKENCDTSADEGPVEPGNAECGALVGHRLLLTQGNGMSPAPADIHEVALSPLANGGVAYGTGATRNWSNNASDTSASVFMMDFDPQNATYVAFLEPDGTSSANLVRMFDLFELPGGRRLYTGGYRGDYGMNPPSTVQSGLFGQMASDLGSSEWELVAPGVDDVPAEEVLVLDVAVNGSVAYVVGYAERDVFGATYPTASAGAYLFVSRFALNGTSTPQNPTTFILGNACTTISGEQFEADVQVDSQGRVWVAGALCSNVFLPGTMQQLTPGTGRKGFVTVWDANLTRASGALLSSSEVRVAGLAPASNGTMMLAASFTGSLAVNGVDAGTSAGGLDVALTRFGATGPLDQPVIAVGHTRIYGGDGDERVTSVRVPLGSLGQGVFVSGYAGAGEARFDDWIDTLAGVEKKAFVLKSEWISGATLAQDEAHAIWARFLGDAGRTEGHDVLVVADDVWIAGAIGQGSATSTVTLSQGTVYSATSPKTWFLARFTDTPTP